MPATYGTAKSSGGPPSSGGSGSGGSTGPPIIIIIPPYIPNDDDDNFIWNPGPITIIIRVPTVFDPPLSDSGGDSIWVPNVPRIIRVPTVFDPPLSGSGDDTIWVPTIPRIIELPGPIPTGPTIFPGPSLPRIIYPDPIDDTGSGDPVHSPYNVFPGPFPIEPFYIPNVPTIPTTVIIDTGELYISPAVIFPGLTIIHTPTGIYPGPFTIGPLDYIPSTTTIPTDTGVPTVIIYPDPIDDTGSGDYIHTPDKVYPGPFPIGPIDSITNVPTVPTSFNVTTGELYISPSVIFPGPTIYPPDNIYPGPVTIGPLDYIPPTGTVPTGSGVGTVIEPVYIPNVTTIPPDTGIPTVTIYPDPIDDTGSGDYIHTPDRVYPEPFPIEPVYVPSTTTFYTPDGVTTGELFFSPSVITNPGSEIYTPTSVDPGPATIGPLDYIPNVTTIPPDTGIPTVIIYPDPIDDAGSGDPFGDSTVGAGYTIEPVYIPNVTTIPTDTGIPTVIVYPDPIDDTGSGDYIHTPDKVYPEPYPIDPDYIPNQATTIVPTNAIVGSDFDISPPSYVNGPGSFGSGTEIVLVPYVIGPLDYIPNVTTIPPDTGTPTVIIYPDPIDDTGSGDYIHTPDKVYPEPYPIEPDYITSTTTFYAPDNVTTGVIIEPSVIDDGPGDYFGDFATNRIIYPRMHGLDYDGDGLQYDGGDLGYDEREEFFTTGFGLSWQQYIAPTYVPNTSTVPEGSNTTTSIIIYPDPIDDTGSGDGFGDLSTSRTIHPYMHGLEYGGDGLQYDGGDLGYDEREEFFTTGFGLSWQQYIAPTYVPNTSTVPGGGNATTSITIYPDPIEDGGSGDGFGDLSTSRTISSPQMHAFGYDGDELQYDGGALGYDEREEFFTDGFELIPPVSNITDAGGIDNSGDGSGSGGGDGSLIYAPLWVATEQLPAGSLRDQADGWWAFNSEDSGEVVDLSNSGNFLTASGTPVSSTYGQTLNSNDDYFSMASAAQLSYVWMVVYCDHAAAVGTTTGSFLALMGTTAAPYSYLFTGTAALGYGYSIDGASVDTGRVTFDWSDEHASTTNIGNWGWVADKWSVLRTRFTTTGGISAGDFSTIGRFLNPTLYQTRAIFAEVIAFETAPSQATIDAVDDYLHAKYGPDGHGIIPPRNMTVTNVAGTNQEQMTITITNNNIVTESVSSIVVTGETVTVVPSLPHAIPSGSSQTYTVSGGSGDNLQSDSFTVGFSGASFDETGTFPQVVSSAGGVDNSADNSFGEWTHVQDNTYVAPSATALGAVDGGWWDFERIKDGEVYDVTGLGNILTEVGTMSDSGTYGRRITANDSYFTIGTPGKFVYMWIVAYLDSTAASTNPTTQDGHNAIMGNVGTPISYIFVPNSTSATYMISLDGNISDLGYVAVDFGGEFGTANVGPANELDDRWSVLRIRYPGAADPGTTFTRIGSFVGTATVFDSRITFAEVIACLTTPSTAEITAIEDYLKAKYGPSEYGEGAIDIITPGHMEVTDVQYIAADVMEITVYNGNLTSENVTSILASTAVTITPTLPYSIASGSSYTFEVDAGGVSLVDTSFTVGFSGSSDDETGTFPSSGGGGSGS